jgi:hypothetical protein
LSGAAENQMANSLLTIDMITKESLRILENNLTFAKGVNRQFDSSFGVDGAKIGDTVRIRKPTRYTVRTGAAMSTQDNTDQSTSLQLTTQAGVDLSFSSRERALSLDEFGDRVLKPAIAAIANKIDADGLAQYKNVHNNVGTAGTAPSALSTFLNGKVKMADDGTPQDELISAVVGAQAEANLVDALKGLFAPPGSIAEQYESGKMGRAGGMKFSMDQNINTHTVGPLGGTPLVNGGSQTGSSLVTDGWTAAAASRLKQGDTFTIANVFHVNPQSRVSTGVLQQFVVTADVSSDGSGNATIPIYPAITTTTAYQTVNASPADNAAITVTGAASTVTPQHMIFHRDAFVLACADLPLPGGVDMAARASSEKLGISIRLVRAYDIANDLFPCRLDVLYGFKTVYPELACRVYG